MEPIEEINEETKELMGRVASNAKYYLANKSKNIALCLRRDMRNGRCPKQSTLEKHGVGLKEIAADFTEYRQRLISRGEHMNPVKFQKFQAMIFNNIKSTPAPQEEI